MTTRSTSFPSCSRASAICFTKTPRSGASGPGYICDTSKIRMIVTKSTSAPIGGGSPPGAPLPSIYVENCGKRRRRGCRRSTPRTLRRLVPALQSGRSAWRWPTPRPDRVCQRSRGLDLRGRGGLQALWLPHAARRRPHRRQRQGRLATCRVALEPFLGSRACLNELRCAETHSRLSDASLGPELLDAARKTGGFRRL